MTDIVDNAGPADSAELLSFSGTVLKEDVSAANDSDDVLSMAECMYTGTHYTVPGQTEQAAQTAGTGGDVDV